MIKDFQTYINEGLFDRNQSEFNIQKTDKGIEQVYIPKTKDELYSYIEPDIEQAKKDGTYPNVNLNNIDVSRLGNDELKGLFSGDNVAIRKWLHINPDISNWNIKYIPSNFFDDNKKIKKFTIPNSATSIGDFAFWDCINLKSVTIPNNVTSIGRSAFYGCKGLKSITIPNSVTIIGSMAFYNCSGLTSVEIPNNVTEICGQTFQNCSSLTSVTIPNSVTTIGMKAFDFCSNLTSVNISKLCHINTMSFPKNCKIIRRDD